MAELNIQADHTAGIFRVYVDGRENVPDQIKITALPGKKIKVHLISTKGKSVEYNLDEMYLNGRTSRTRLRSDELRRDKGGEDA